MKHPLHTIGYEGSDIQDFLATVREAGVELVIDVRDVPVSRKRGFSKHILASNLKACNVDYMHLKGLGDPKPGRIAAREGKFDVFRRIFGDHMRTEVARTDLTRAIHASRSRFACLLCFERDHRNCHRCIVAEEMARLGGFRLVHLGVQPVRSSRSRSLRADAGTLPIVG